MVDAYYEHVKILKNDTLAVECRKIETLNNSEYILLPTFLYSTKEIFNSDCFYLDENAKKLITAIETVNDKVTTTDTYLQFHLQCLKNTGYDLYMYFQIFEELHDVVSLSYDFSEKGECNETTLRENLEEHFLENENLDILSELTLLKYNIAYDVDNRKNIIKSIIDGDNIQKYNRVLDFSLYINAKNSDINNIVKLYSYVQYVELENIAEYKEVSKQ